MKKVTATFLVDEDVLIEKYKEYYDVDNFSDALTGEFEVMKENGVKLLDWNIEKDNKEEREIKVNGCARAPIVHNGKVYEPIKVGDPNDWYFGEAPGTRCTDCGAMMGHYHHPGCDNERCPVCGGQLITCDCQDEE